MTVINKISPYRNKRVQGNTQKWFHSEVLEKLNARDNFLRNSNTPDIIWYIKIDYIQKANILLSEAFRND